MPGPLGADPQTGRRLIVTADDFGLTEATSTAIMDAHRDGMVTATSALGNGPATTSMLARVRDHTDLDVGLHGALVGEDPPVSAAREVPTLVDGRGRLARSWRVLLPRLTAGRVDPDDVRRELDAQLQLVSESGVSVGHIDLHQHLQLWPGLQPIVVAMARAAGIGYLRVPSSAARGPRGIGVRRLAASLETSVRAAGLVTSDGFLGLDEAGHWTGPRLRWALARVEGEVVEVNVHPGSFRDQDRHRYRWAYQWADELAAVMDPRTAQAAADVGFLLARPSEIGGRLSAGARRAVRHPWP